MASNPPPSATVYARNLEERIKVEQLKESLRELFAEYGTIIDIVAKTNLKAKGQAFIVFDSVDSAQKAIDEVQGFELFGKEMELAFAKTRSDATVKRQGGEEELESHKRRRLAEKDKKKAAEQAESQKLLKRPGAAAPEAARPIKATRGAGLKSSNPSGGAVIPDEYLPPNKILFVQNLPDEYEVNALTSIFERFEGFKEVRLVPGRTGIAFVEYESEVGAISAKENTAGMPLGAGSQIIKVTYQRQ
ncbi:RNA-binding, RBD [Glarea lozoyensis ATCC 20868]|uniref:RNA-binding, RBD n=1 Tax=Glarea lozoyensis (strain ATCC 20868 / MF5171) TaxID=1116229 RepID=S3DSL9_GLAL2|nr:RNA-binding, RBD [Glarea lozoyensis ATCC 20868]EPE34966.1 RNA-binding, RBD [Glarea lozoyensis ATCC 20868]